MISEDFLSRVCVIKEANDYPKELREVFTLFKIEDVYHKPLYALIYREHTYW